jgi:AraC-like DNA-binding protein
VKGIVCLFNKNKKTEYEYAMTYCDATPASITHKQMSSLGDQNYPSFELRAVYAYLSSQGHELWCMQQLVLLGLKLSDLQQPFLQSHIALAGLNNVIETFYEPGLGCKVAQNYSVTELGAIGACVGSASTLGEAMEISQTYYELLGSFTDIVNIVDEHSFTNRLVDVAKLDPRLLQLLFELTVAGMMKMAEEISAKKVNILHVRFSMPLSDDDKNTFSNLFNCPVEDNCNFNEWVLDIRSLSLTVNHDACSTITATSDLRFLLDELNKEQGLVDNIDSILKCSGGDYPDPNMISNALGMSGRTMRRRLNKMGTSFSALIDKVRCQLAINLIQNQNLSNEALAEELGYSDAANFYNAFKKWTGNAPAYYRIEHLGQTHCR